MGWFVAEKSLDFLSIPLSQAYERHEAAMTKTGEKVIPAAAVLTAPGGVAQTPAATPVAPKPQMKAVYQGPLELLFTKLKIAFIIALAASFPWISYQVYGFVAPGSTRRSGRP